MNRVSLVKKEGLTEFELYMLSQSSHTSVQFAEGREVTVIIPDDVKEIMDLLAQDKIRRTCSIPESSYLFVDEGQFYNQHIMLVPIAE